MKAKEILAQNYLGNLLTNLDGLPIIMLFQEWNQYLLYKNIEYINENKENIEKWIFFKINKLELIDFFSKKHNLNQILMSKLSKNEVQLALIDSNYNIKNINISEQNMEHKALFKRFATNDSYFSINGYEPFAIDFYEKLIFNN